MKRFLKAAATVGLASVLLVGLVVSAKEKKPKKQDLRAQVEAAPDPVWPPPPDQPRLKWVAQYHDEYHVDAKKKSRFMNALTGAKEEIFQIQRPVSVAVDSQGVIFVGDFHQGIVQIDPAAKKMALFPIKVGIKQLQGLAVTDKLLYACDAGQGEVFIFDRAGNNLGSLGGSKYLQWPTALALSKDGTLLYVVDTHGHRIQVFDVASQALVRTIGRRGTDPGQFNYPVGIALLSNGNLVISDFGNFRIQILNPTGKPLAHFGEAGDRPPGFSKIKGVAVDRDDNIYVAEGKFSTVLVFDATGKWLTMVGGDGYEKGRFSLPVGLCYVGDKLYIADQMNARIQVIQYLEGEQGH